MAATSTLRVVVRFRPLNETEVAQGPEPCVEYRGQSEIFVRETSSFASSKNASHGGSVLDVAQQRQFTFDSVFQPASAQEDLFNKVGKPVIENVLTGYNGTILAYGQTGSGKTHSMLGPEGGTVDVLSTLSEWYPQRGMIPRLVEELFARLSKFPEQEVSYKVTCSVFELYKEQVIDLLCDGAQQDYRIREDIIGGKGIYVDNLYTKRCLSASELLEAVRVGVTRRKVGATKSNATSSRSHSLTVIGVELVNHVLDERTTNSRLNLVDLAGSEKVGKTQADGERLKEAQMINLSLTLLGNVIYKLTDGKSGYIPYRDSKLTRILQDSFGGNSVTTLLCHCSPAMFNREETLGTLRFAARAKQIRNKPVVNREMSLKELQVQLAQALDRIKFLDGKLAFQSGNSCNSPRGGSKSGRVENAFDSNKDALSGLHIDGEADDLKELTSSLLLQLEDLKRDLFQREEDLQVAAKQVEFYKLRAEEAAQGMENLHRKVKRDEGLNDRRFTDLMAENKTLQDQISQQTSCQSTVSGRLATPVSVANRKDFPKTAPVTPVDALQLECSGVRVKDAAAAAGKKPKTLRKMTSDSQRGSKLSLPVDDVAPMGVLTTPEAMMQMTPTVSPTPPELISTTMSAILELEKFAEESTTKSRTHNGATPRAASSPPSPRRVAQNASDLSTVLVGTIAAFDQMQPVVNDSIAHPDEPPVRRAVMCDVSIMAQVGTSSQEYEQQLDDLNRNLKAMLQKNAIILQKERDASHTMERLAGNLEKVTSERDDNQQELDAMRKVLEGKERENALMKRILDDLNINIEDYMSQLGHAKTRNMNLECEADGLRGANDSLRQTQEQLEFADMASMELLIKTEDITDVERDIDIMASTEDQFIFDRKKASCLEVVAELKRFLDSITSTLMSRKFNTGTLESRRLGLVSDAASMLVRVEECQSLIHEFGTFDGS